jgi:hypothetical protein
MHRASPVDRLQAGVPSKADKGQKDKRSMLKQASLAEEREAGLENWRRTAQLRGRRRRRHGDVGSSRVLVHVPKRPPCLTDVLAETGRVSQHCGWGV